MERWARKIVLVIPAHTKCGCYVIQSLLKHKITVIGLAPFKRQIEMLRVQFPTDQCKNFYTRECDLNSLGAIKAALLWMRDNFPEKPRLVIYFLPIVSQCHAETLYDKGQEYRLQPLLDVCEHSVKKFCSEVSRILLKTPVCWCTEKACCPFWFIPHNRDEKDEGVVVKEILDRMAKSDL